MKQYPGLTGVIPSANSWENPIAPLTFPFSIKCFPRFLSDSVVNGLSKTLKLTILSRIEKKEMCSKHILIAT